MRDELRQTGRTTAMLQRAKNAHDKGRKVVVIAANKRHALQLKKELGEKYKQIKVLSKFASNEALLGYRFDDIFKDHSIYERN